MGRIAWHGKTNLAKPRSSLAAHIGGQLLKLRQKRQIPMSEVARLTGLAQSFVCQLENGQREPGAGTLWKLCQTFSVSMNYWFQGYSGE